MIEWIDTIIQGSLLGGLYALFAIGLSITYGVMRLVNIAHGDFMILAAYIALPLVSGLALSPLAVIPAVAMVMFALGYLLQRSLLNRTLGADILPPLLVTFGFSIVIQNGLREVFSSDSRSLPLGALETASLSIGDSIAIGWFPLIAFLVALALALLLNLMLTRTRTGMALRATSDDPATASLTGIRSAHVYGLAMALSFTLVAVGGIFSGIRTTFTPEAGPLSLLYSFEAVVIGGLGSVWGTFAGAVILGVAQAIGAKFDAGLGILAGHLVFLAVLLMRPKGLMEKTP